MRARVVRRQHERTLDRGLRSSSTPGVLCEQGQGAKAHAAVVQGAARRQLARVSPRARHDVPKDILVAAAADLAEGGLERRRQPEAAEVAPRPDVIRGPRALAGARLRQRLDEAPLGDT